MATYKVPQDVEADDKLIGPFSFRQFIYLIIVALAGALAWGLAQLFIGLAIIPLPIILLFGALALPLRKDQPMEIYLAAIVSFYLKPHKRLWDPDGVDSTIKITAPKIIEIQRAKNITQADAEERFSYLANLVDSQGWAIRGAGTTAPQSVTINNAIYEEAAKAEDLFDDNNHVAQNFETIISKETGRQHQEAVEQMRPPQPQPDTLSQDTPTFNPYPEFQQTVIQPIDNESHTLHQPTDNNKSQLTPSPKPVSADIMNLANNPDLSIETIAHQAQRIHEKEDNTPKEVVIKLR